jgi:predicted transcriptional regulator
MSSQKQRIAARVAEAKHYRVNGMTQKAIAETMGVSVRTVRDYLHKESEEEPESMATIDPTHLEEILAVGHPLLLDLLKNIRTQLDEGNLSARDGIIAYGVVSDKLGRLTKSGKDDASEVEVLKAKLIVAQYNEAVALHALEQVRQGDMRYLDAGAIQAAVEP